MFFFLEMPFCEVINLCVFVKKIKKIKKCDIIQVFSFSKPYNYISILLTSVLFGFLFFSFSPFVGSKPFKCKICHFAAAQLGDARNHVKRHLGMREYKCHVCGWVNDSTTAVDYCKRKKTRECAFLHHPKWLWLRWLTLCMHTLLFIVMVNSLNTVMTCLSYSNPALWMSNCMGLQGHSEPVICKLPKL